MQHPDLPPLRFPRQYRLDICRLDTRLVVLDPVRRRYVPLTPEEWVRQNLVQFLIQDRGCPAGLVAIEKSLDFHGKPFRADVVVHDRQGLPVLLAECKEPGVGIDARVFEQMANYNRVLLAPYLLVTNGLRHHCAQLDPDSGACTFLPDLPSYAEMLATGPP